MPAEWATKKELEKNVFRVLSDNSVPVDSVDSDLLEQGKDGGKDAIIAKLRKRGYNMAQIETWRQLKEYHLDIGTWFTLNRTGFRRGDEEDWISFYDRREELDELELYDTSGGQIIPGEEPHADKPFCVLDLAAINAALDQEP